MFRITLSIVAVVPDIWKQAARATFWYRREKRNWVVSGQVLATWTVRHPQEMPAGVKPAAALGGSPGSKESALIKIRGQHTKPCCAMLVRAR